MRVRSQSVGPILLVLLANDSDWEDFEIEALRSTPPEDGFEGRMLSLGESIAFGRLYERCLRLRHCSHAM